MQILLVNISDYAVVNAFFIVISLSIIMPLMWQLDAF